MTYKYGIYQSTSSSCVFYKQDEDGNQSTFNIFVSPKKNESKEKDIIAFIDNEQMKQENWLSEKKFDVNELVEAFGGWATDAPIIFELEAQKSMTHCLSSIIKDIQ